MYIKYLDNIHNLDNFLSIVKGQLEVTTSHKDNCIYLVKQQNHFSMAFLTEDARNFILAKIWDDMKAGVEFLDIDEILPTFYDAEKYKI